jgi:glycosyltransferase involved in cell wall biosynthesis
LEYTEGIRLNLAGRFTGIRVDATVKNHPAWPKVNELGFLNRKQVNEFLARSKAGLLTLHPAINFIDALPVKMFEYMAAGIPVISSNFPLYYAYLKVYKWVIKL